MLRRSMSWGRCRVLQVLCLLLASMFIPAQAWSQSPPRPIKEGDQVYLQSVSSGRFLIAPQTYLGYDCARVGNGESRVAVQIKGNAGSKDTAATGSPALGAQLKAGDIVGIDFESTTFEGATRVYESIQGNCYLDIPQKRTANDKFWWRMRRSIPYQIADFLDSKKTDAIVASMKVGSSLMEGDFVTFENVFYPGTYITESKSGGDWQWLGCSEQPCLFRVLLVSSSMPVLAKVGEAYSDNEIITVGKYIQNESGPGNQAGQQSFEISLEEQVGISTTAGQSWGTTATVSYQVGPESSQFRAEISASFEKQYQQELSNVKTLEVKKSVTQSINNPDYGCIIAFQHMKVPFQVQDYVCDGVRASIRKLAGSVGDATYVTHTIPYRDVKTKEVKPISWATFENPQKTGLIDQLRACGATVDADLAVQRKAAWKAKGWITEDGPPDAEYISSGGGTSPETKPNRK